MKAIIVEDKAYIRKGLLNLLEIIESDIDVIGECESVAEATTVTKTCKPELIFLDINLTDGTAFDFLDQFNQIDFKIIFITAHEEYALKALKTGAIDYLLKPVDLTELEIALKKIQETSIQTQQEQLKTVQQVINKTEDKLILSMQDSFQVIELDELIYCESDSGYTTFYCTDNRKYVVSKTLKEFEEQLTNANFNRPHQSFMVNLKFIDKYDKSGSIYLKNGFKIPVSTRKKETFLASFFNIGSNKKG